MRRPGAEKTQLLLIAAAVGAVALAVVLAFAR
jgi:uncharacterized protein involved in exopolysaccharide biosynthesis